MQKTNPSRGTVFGEQVIRLDTEADRDHDKFRNIRSEHRKRHTRKPYSLFTDFQFGSSAGVIY